MRWNWINKLIEIILTCKITKGTECGFYIEMLDAGYANHTTRLEDMVNLSFVSGTW